MNSNATENGGFGGSIDDGPLKQAMYDYTTENPTRVIKTEGFERLFSHYTGLHGDELMQYLQEFQSKALKVHPDKTC